MFRTGNPTLGEDTFAMGRPQSREAQMSLNGTIHRTFFLLTLLVISAGFTWRYTVSLTTPEAIYPWMIGSAIGGLVLALGTVFAKSWAWLTAPAYALVEGIFIGAISALFEQMYPGIVYQAVILTFGIMACMLFAYRSGWIKVTQKFRTCIVAATGGIMLVYLASFIMGFFGVQMPMIHGSGPIGIGFSLFVVVIASLNLVLDFDLIDKGTKQGAPKYMEWYGAFALLVTLVWLYIEILRLLSKLRR